MNGATTRAVWLDDEGNTFTGRFEGGKEYTIKVPVRALSNCSFTGAGLTATVNGTEAGADYTDNKNIFVKLTVTVPEAENIIEEASATVIAPAADVKPSTHIESADSSAYGCRVNNWYKTGSDDPMGYTTFRKGESYDVEVEFYPMTDYDFSPVTVFTINGKEATVISRDGSKVTVRATVASGVKYLSTMSATVTEPADGANQNFDALMGDPMAYRLNDVAWFIKGHKERMHPTDRFEAGKTYVCRMSFFLNDGYETDSDTTVTINGKDARIIYGDPGVVSSAEVDFTVGGGSGSGYKITGNVTSYLSAYDTTSIELIDSSDAVIDVCNLLSETTYEFSNAAAGKYTLRVSKTNHVTRDYEITVSGDTTQDVTICPIGDVSMNGKVQANDAMMAYQHAQGKTDAQLSGYAFLLADVAPVGSPNGKVQAADAMVIYQQAQGKNSLF